MGVGRQGGARRTSKRPSLATCIPPCFATIIHIRVYPDRQVAARNGGMCEGDFLEPLPRLQGSAAHIAETLNYTLAKGFQCHQLQIDFPLVSAGDCRDSQVLREEHWPVRMDGVLIVTVLRPVLRGEWNKRCSCPENSTCRICKVLAQSRLKDLCISYFFT